MLKRKFKKSSTPMIVALALLFSSVPVIPAFADGSPIIIQPNGHRLEVESNDTVENANIIPFNDSYSYVEGIINNAEDNDNYTFTAGKTQDSIIKFQQLCRINKEANYFFYLYDVTGDEVIYGQSLPNKMGVAGEINFKLKAGHKYICSANLEGSYDAIEEAVSRSYGCKYVIMITTK